MFMATAIVPSPTARLLDIVEKGQFAPSSKTHAKVAKNGCVTARLYLLPDTTLSAGMHPQGWKVNPVPSDALPDAYVPRQDNSLTVYVFDTPDFLADEQVSWRIVKREKSVRLPDYESCSVITDSRGLPLFFFRCTSTVNDRFSTHPTNSYFSAQLLSQLKWEVQCASEPAIGRLTVDRFSIYVENGYLTVRKEILYRTDGSEIADPNNLTADVLPEKWSPALQGLRARLACTGQFDCRGHYHKNPPK